MSPPVPSYGDLYAEGGAFASVSLKRFDEPRVDPVRLGRESVLPILELPFPVRFFVFFMDDVLLEAFIA